MQIVDTIAELQTFNFGGAQQEIPLRNYSSGNAAVTDENLVIITDIVVVDSATVTNPDLDPARNTLITAPTPTPTPTPNNSGGSSGGSMSVWLLVLAFAVRILPSRKAN